MEYKDSICESEKLCFFDSHAHYYDDRFYGEENPEGAEVLLEELFAGEVCGIVNIGTCAKTSALCIEQAKKFEKMYAAVGIHPEDCHFITDPEAALAALSALLENEETRKQNKIVALGEIGLDYHWQSYDNGRIPMNKELQAFFFDEQMKLAERLSLPVIIHDREAHGDCFETVLRYPNVKGVFHSYSGSAEMARELTKRGWYISFSGTVTFTNAARVREAAAAVPRDKLLIETDAPYLAPHPNRGKINHSGYLTFVLDALAQIWNCSPTDAALQTCQNAIAFFDLP